MYRFKKQNIQKDPLFPKDVPPTATPSIANESAPKKIFETDLKRHEKTFNILVASPDMRQDEPRVSLEETLLNLTEDKGFFNEYLACVTDDDEKVAEAFRTLLALKEVIEDTNESDLSKTIEDGLNKAPEINKNYFFSVVSANMTKQPFENTHPEKKGKRWPISGMSCASRRICFLNRQAGRTKKHKGWSA